MQSALDPHGPAAAAIWQLGLVMTIGGAIIFVAVMALALWAVLRGTALPRARGTGLVVVGGIAFPLVVLTALLVYLLVTARALTAPAPPDALRIEVIGHMWWWEVRYPQHGFATANELRIPVGVPAVVEVTTQDVIHSFWVPNLAGKIDMIPGRTNRIRLQADRPGQFRGQCAEYCGLQHARMAFFVVAEEPADFARWLEKEKRPAQATSVPHLLRGRAAFLSSGCGACHVVRGTPADGTMGPDLTHVGGRVSLAAATLGNGVGWLAGWIADSQHLKPGNRMPSFDTFDGRTLNDIAAWLDSLK